MLAGGGRAVVTAGAVARNVVVIEVRGRPRICRVAVVTRIARGDVRWVLTCRGGAIMTT